MQSPSWLRPNTLRQPRRALAAAVLAAVAVTTVGTGTAQASSVLFPLLNGAPVYKPHTLLWSNAAVYRVSWAEWSRTLAVGLGSSWVDVVTGMRSHQYEYLPTVVILTGASGGLFDNLEVVVSGTVTAPPSFLGPIVTGGMGNGDYTYNFPSGSAGQPDWPVL